MKVLQAERKEAKAESDSAFERFRTDMEKGINSMREKNDSNTTKIMIGMGISVTVLSLVIAFVGILLRF
ncbi:MAG: hypothetical protein OXF05_04060 [Hyphomicrobiales bacterium]|nr:hypothetical protein [Hyphomicrobiales bacterium]MCY4033631.1 hypothetical protein [Hyphomicrobiales bacterium]MCY4039009.1 hypothetical protein [Hyphomicrobiales bacterium]